MKLPYNVEPGVREAIETAETWTREAVLDNPDRALDVLQLLAQACLRMMEAPLTDAEAGAIQAVSEVEVLRRALEVVAVWDPKTFPRVPDLDEPGRTMSYGLAYGSNGERDFMRDVARKALESTTPVSRVCTSAGVEEARTRVAQLEAVLHELGSHFDFGEPWPIGDVRIEDPSSINDVFTRAKALLDGTEPSGRVFTEAEVREALSGLAPRSAERAALRRLKLD